MSTGHEHWSRSRGAAVAALLAGLVLAACTGASGSKKSASGGSNDGQKPKDAIAVRATRIEREPLSSLYSTSATLRADKSATLTARTRGVIRRLLVEEGQRVAEGAPVAILEDEEQRIAAERAATTRDTKAREFERARALHAQRLLSDEAFETARREAEDAKNAAALADLALSRTVIRAPFSGVILKRHVDVGATVSDGTPVYDLADLDPLYADVNVPERHVARLAPGQKVRLAPDAGGAGIEGRIERIGPAVDPATGTVKVTLAVVGSAGMRPGAFVIVNIVTDTHPHALVVPRAALVSEGRRWHLFRVGEAGETAERLEVTLGFEEGDRVEVFGVGEAAAKITPGAAVVVAGASALTDGARIQVTEWEPAARSRTGSEPAPG